MGPDGKRLTSLCMTCVGVHGSSPLTCFVPSHPVLKNLLTKGSSVMLCVVCNDVAVKMEMFIDNVTTVQAFMQTTWQRQKCGIATSIHSIRPYIKRLATEIGESTDLPVVAPETVFIPETPKLEAPSEYPQVKDEIGDDESTDNDSVVQDYPEADPIPVVAPPVNAVLKIIGTESVAETPKTEVDLQVMQDEDGAIETNIGRTPDENCKELPKTGNVKMMMKMEGKGNVKNTVAQVKEGDSSPAVMSNVMQNAKAEKTESRAVENGITSEKDAETNLMCLYLTDNQLRIERERERRAEPYLSAPWRCDDCIEGFNFEDHYLRHMEKHSERHGPIACDICNLRYPSSGLLTAHKTTHYRRHECVRCRMKFKDKLSWTDHVKKSCVFTKFQCHICQQSFKTKRSLSKHINKHEGKYMAKAMCPHCHKIYANTVSMRYHIKLKHSAEPPIRNFKCSKCCKRFVLEASLSKHEATHSEPTDYYCVECDKRFSTKETYKTHLSTTLRHATYDGFRFECDYCHRKFSARRAIERHINGIHLHYRPYKCKVCNKGYPHEDGVRAHVRATHERAKYLKLHPCDICDKVFKTVPILQAHRRTHTGERPYMCTVCAATFTQNSALYTHNKLVHLKQKRNLKSKKSRPAKI